MKLPVEYFFKNKLKSYIKEDEDHAIQKKIFRKRTGKRERKKQRIQVNWIIMFITFAPIP